MPSSCRSSSIRPLARWSAITTIIYNMALAAAAVHSFLVLGAARDAGGPLFLRACRNSVQVG
jgi:hypothetical protein